MKIWIDLSNSPHPLLFGPVAERLEEDGHEVAVTARDNAQTVELARTRWPSVEVIGGESPKGRARKLQTLARRVRDLRRWASGEKPDLALSHNSYAQIVAAAGLRIPTVTAMDYEHQPANHLAFRLARGIVAPVALRSILNRQGATPRKIRYYDGLKEEVYLGDFNPDPAVLERLGVAANGDRVVVMRTPPSRAIYHRVENTLFVDLLKRVSEESGAWSVVLTRFPEQRRELRELGLPRCVVPESAVDSRSLLYAADLFIGAGGTMTREAALMGIPTFSTFAAKRAAVDVWLEERGLLRYARDVDDVLPIERRQGEPKDPGALRARSAELVRSFAATSLDAAGLNGRR